MVIGRQIVRHWCVKYPVNLLYDIPTLMKEAKRIRQWNISVHFQQNHFPLTLNGIKGYIYA